VTLLESDVLTFLRKAPSDYYDSVVDTFGLCSYGDPTTVLEEVTRVVKPGEVVLLLEHGRTPEVDRRGKGGEKVLFDEEGYYKVKKTSKEDNDTSSAGVVGAAGVPADKSSLHTYLDDLLDRGLPQHLASWGGCHWNRPIEQIVADAGLNVTERRVVHFGTGYLFRGRK